MDMEPLIAICRKLIEEKLQWGESHSWSSEDFETLSELIFEKTQVRLSLTTLKRIWGKVKYESSPNLATLNALAQFVDYGNWREFRQTHGDHNNDRFKAEAVPEISDLATMSSGQPIGKPIGWPKRRVLLFVPLGLVLLIVSSFLYVAWQKANSRGDSEVKPLFESKKTTDDLPNSVVFHYDASMYGSDSVFIQQNWDPNRRESVDPQGHYHTSIYYYPGYFGARLIVDGDIKAMNTVFIKTQGWKALIDQSPVPVYLHADEVEGDGFMGIDSEIYQQKLGISVFNDTWATFHNVREFEGTDGTNFHFEASLRNSSTVEEAACRRLIVYILGSASAYIVPLADKGCISDLAMLTASGWVNGKDSDMSAFGCDFSEFQKLAFGVANDTLMVSLNENLIFSQRERGTIGEIVGIRFAFEGAGQVKEVSLKKATQTIYQETF